MIAFFVTVYTALVVVLLKFKIVKPRPYPIALIVLAGIVLIGAVVAAWTLCAPVSMRVVASHHIVQIVPYVKGQIKKLYARPMEPLHQGDPLLKSIPRRISTLSISWRRSSSPRRIMSSSPKPACRPREPT